MATVERQVTLGADPEIAVYVSDSRPGDSPSVRPYPVCGLMGGEKGNPVKKVTPSGDDVGGWLEDGVMLELNPTASTNPKVLCSNINALLTLAESELLGKSTKTRAFSLKYPGSSYYYTYKDLAKHKQAVEFGCSPDYDAYADGDPRYNVMDAAMALFGENIRFAGGHVHLGVTNWPQGLPKFIAARFLDILLFVPSIHSTRSVKEIISERGLYYGKLGLFRETSYGIEYRTPGNFWLMPNFAHTFITRLKFVGEIFAEFERYRSDLVEIYNQVRWDFIAHYFSTTAREAGFKQTEYMSAYSAVRAVGGAETASPWLVIGDKHVPLLDWNGAVKFRDERGRVKLRINLPEVQQEMEDLLIENEPDNLDIERVVHVPVWALFNGILFSEHGTAILPTREFERRHNNALPIVQRDQLEEVVNLVEWLMEQHPDSVHFGVDEHGQWVGIPEAALIRLNLRFEVVE